MNYGPLIFLAAFFGLASSWFGFVLMPQVQIGRLQQTNTLGTGTSYPLARPGLAQEGREVYRANGCAACHSQQVGQTGTRLEVALTDVGTNQPAVVVALLKLNPALSEPEAKQLVAGLPKPVLQNVSKDAAEAAVKALNAAGAKSQIWVVPAGPDIARGWGKRRSVAEDYLYDYPVMLGPVRAGPDLANVGLRQPDANWHLHHLYAPQFEVKGSTMPPYRFLFQTRKIERERSPDALALTNNLAPPAGYEIVPRTEAKALTAYLLSLRADAPLFDAPMTVPAAAPASTNAPPSQGMATNTAPTNVPVK